MAANTVKFATDAFKLKRVFEKSKWLLSAINANALAGDSHFTKCGPKTNSKFRIFSNKY